jgi:uncharacterized protein YprB with RNaseH-like and TPR domain
MSKKILFFDVEASGLKTSVGILIAIGIYDPLTQSEPEAKIISKPEEEVELLKWFENKIKENGYDTLCGWNSKKYDLPFILGRALQLGLNFSWLINLNHIDLIEISRKNFLFHSNSMEEVCNLLKIEYNPTIPARLVGFNFMKFLTGNKEAAKEIVERCKQDVKALSELYKKFEPYILNSVTHNQK